MPPALHNATSGKCLDYQQMSGLAPLRPMKHPPQGELRVFQHPLNFCFCDEALKLQQLIIFTGVIDMAEAFA